MWLLTGTSCSHKTLETAIQDDSVAVISQTDTVRDTRVITQKVTEYIDRWNDRLVVVNTAGDTVKDYRKNTVYIEKDSRLQDSLTLYKAAYASLLTAKKRIEYKYIEVTKPPSFKERIKEALVWIITGAVLTLVTIRKIKNRHG